MTLVDRFSAYEDGQRRIDYRRDTVARPVTPAVPALTSPPSVPAPKVRPPDPPGLLLGELDTGGGIAIDLPRLLVGRLLIQGVSGAGKSWTLRRLLEQARGQVQLIVIDPEGEYGSLAEALGIPHVMGHTLDAAALRELALRCRERRLSIVLDLSECDRTGQMIAVAPFLEGLVDAPREHWRPCVVAIDEAHLFAPFGGHSTADTSVRKAAIGAVVDVMGRGRKRGLAGVLATQRLARLAKSVTSEVSNFLVGLNSQDLDIKRAAEQIGWDARKAFDRLPVLQPGEFVAVGRAFSTQPAQLKVGPVRSEHKGAAPTLEAPGVMTIEEARAMLDIEGLIEQTATEAAAADELLNRGTQAVRTFLRDPAFNVAADVYRALREIAPNGTTLKSLATHLNSSLDQVGPAIALLDQFGVIAFGPEPKKGDPKGRPVAIDRAFARREVVGP